MNRITGAVALACGALLCTSADAADALDPEALSARYVEKCPESLQVLVDYLTENNARLEESGEAAAESKAVTESGCGTDADRVYTDMMKPEVIQEMNDLLAKGPEELQKKLDADIKQLAEEILVIEPVLQKVKTGTVNADDMQKMVLFSFVQNRKKSIEEIAAE